MHTAAPMMRSISYSLITFSPLRFELLRIHRPPVAWLSLSFGLTWSWLIRCHGFSSWDLLIVSWVGVRPCCKLFSFIYTSRVISCALDWLSITKSIINNCAILCILAMSMKVINMFLFISHLLMSHDLVHNIRFHIFHLLLKFDILNLSLL